MGPILIFDKSTLESLNIDEAVWLDNFFLTNITPLFFIETLADLEKQVRSGRTPEDVVGSLAYKTPDGGSYLNVHHATLLAGELSNVVQVDMRYGRPIIPRGQTKELGGKTGIIFEQSPEQEAFNRWQRKEFLQLERLIAKAWRKNLSNINFENNYQFFQKFFPIGKPKNLTDVKKLVDFNIDGPDQEQLFIFGLSILGVPENSLVLTITRWRNAGRPPIREFAPYFTHVFSVDLFFYLAIAADLIGRGRPSHKIDVAYLYYLPFCMVFTSNDKLHANLAPFFLRKDQSFILGTDLKADLNKLDKHYDKLPDEVKNQGIIRFAFYPPTDDSFLITQLWDKHMSSSWRENQAKPRPQIHGRVENELIKKIRQFEDEAKPISDNKFINSDEADHIMIKRKVYPKKGKWARFPPEVLNKRKNEKGEWEDAN